MMSEGDQKWHRIGIGATDSCEPPNGCWELSLGLQQETNAPNH